MAWTAARNDLLSRLRRPGIALLHLVAMLDGFAVAMVIPLLPRLAAHAGAAPGEWVIIVTLNGILLTIGSFAWARVVVLSRARAIIGLTLGVKALFLAALCLDPSWIGLIVNRGLSGIMVGTPVAVQTLLMAMAGSDSRHRATFISSFAVATGFGLTLGPLAALLVLEDVVPLDTLLLTVAVMTLTLAGIAAFGRQGEIPADAARPAGGKPAPVRDRYTPGVMALLATSGLSRCATTAFPVLLLLCAEAGQQGIAVSFAAVLISLIGFLEIGAQLVAPVAVGRFDQLRINIVLLALISTGLIVAAISLAPVAAVCAAILVAVGGGALRTTLTSWMVDLHQGQVGRLLGDNLGVNGIARAAAPATAGAAFGAGAELVLAAFAAIPLLLIAVIIPATRRPQHFSLNNRLED